MKASSFKAAKGVVRTLGAAVTLLGVLLSGCAGRGSAKEHYAERVREVHEKYDPLVVPATKPYIARTMAACDEFLEGLKNQYKYWRPSAKAVSFCQTHPSLGDRLKFEWRIRTAHNQAVLRSRGLKLARLAKASADEAAPPAAALSPETEYEQQSSGQPANTSGPQQEYEQK